MKKDTKLIIIRGNSGSGKTTLAKALQKKFGHGTMLISQDIVRREMLYVTDKPNSRTDELLFELAMFGKRNCRIIILEGILDTKLYEKLFLNLKKEFNEIYAYYFDLPFEETLIRHKDKPNSHEFGETEMIQWWSEKDFIKIISETIITKEQELGTIINVICSQVVT